MDASPYTDADLMQQLAAGDDAALGHLIDRWQRPVLAFAYRYVQDHDAARELTQETFVRLYQARGRFQPERAFPAWLFKIAANLCRNYFRWKKRHPEQQLVDAEPDPAHPSAPESDPAERAAQQDDAARVAAAVKALPHRLKVAVLLYYYEGRSYREIAAVIGCSERGVETRLYRARNLLSASLGLEDGKGKAGGAPSNFPPTAVAPAFTTRTAQKQC
ncbi:MAG: RNA polymerase sigma-70 factor ECF subfamily [Puniceicoccaceae bacterium 5H]|nr:MAG: RNA polymerase sigma-70 factor ECF subfamily [Puniceicoccaceae bacterium 5H]